MRYPEHLIEQIRRQSDITEVIGEVVRLKKQGSGFIGLCPFHADRNPSMHVNPTLGLFKCFSCGKGGNVITFIMEFHRLTFQEAVKNLAQRAHVALPDEPESGVQSETRNRHEAAYRALEAAAKFYTARLKTKEGAAAARYYTAREFGAKLIEEFALGYAPDSWNILSEELHKQGFSEQTLDDAGLIIRRDDGRTYDRFRGRAMFAIHDAAGRIAGFGARRMNDDSDQPKYINSPQSLVYDKSRILYGLFQAKQQVRSDGYAILVEGYADALTLHQAGFRNTVASSGTALTHEQLQLLARYCKQLFIVYDADSAGIKAALRGLELAVGEGFDVRLARLPAGEDPDSFVRKSGADAFRSRLHSAETFLEYTTESLRLSGGFATPQAQAESIRTLVGIVAKVPDTLQHDALMLKIADSLHLGTRELHRIYDELGKARRENSRRTEPPRDIRPPDQSAATQHVDNAVANTNLPAVIQLPPLTGEEREILRIALTVPNALKYLIQNVNLQPESMLTERGRRLIVACRRAFEVAEADPLSFLLHNSELPADEADALAGLVLRREVISERWLNFDVETPPEDARRVMLDSLISMRLRSVEAALTQSKQQLREPDAHGNELIILQRIKELTEERNRLVQSLGVGV